MITVRWFNTKLQRTFSNQFHKIHNALAFADSIGTKAVHVNIQVYA